MHSTNVVICTPGRLLQHFEQTPNFTADELKILGDWKIRNTNIQSIKRINSLKLLSFFIAVFLAAFRN